MNFTRVRIIFSTLIIGLTGMHIGVFLCLALLALPIIAFLSVFLKPSIAYSVKRLLNLLLFIGAFLGLLAYPGHPLVETFFTPLMALGGLNAITYIIQGRPVWEYRDLVIK